MLMLPTRRRRRFPLTALGLVIAVGASVIGSAPAIAATPQPGAVQAAITLPAPLVTYETAYFIDESSVHLFVATQLDPSIEEARYEYQLDNTGPWLTLVDVTGYQGEFPSTEAYALAPPGDHLISLRTSAVVDGKRIVSPGTEPTLVNARGWAKEYTPTYVVSGPNITFSWDARDAQNGWPTEYNILYSINGAEPVLASVVDSVTVTAGYGQSVDFTFYYGGGADFQRYTKVLAHTPAAPGALPLKATPLPSITGRALFGETLAVRTGTWQPAPVALTYQWFSDGKPIQRATDPTFQVGWDEIGKRITVEVRGSRTGYMAVARTSAPTPRVPKASLIARTPNISGTGAVGRTLTASTASWGPGDVFLSYNWKRDGEVITDAYSSTYTLTEADRGHTITAVITGSKFNYPFATRTSSGRIIR
jgi:hypothetical protein